MQVKLSLVGFGVNLVPLELDGQATVKTVLDKFQQVSVFPFYYKAVPSPYRPGVNLLFSFTYLGVTLASILANAPGMEERVWQFYVLDASGMPIPNNSGQGRTPFDKFVVRDGYTVIWRLITVIKQPIQTTKRVRNERRLSKPPAGHRRICCGKRLLFFAGYPRQTGVFFCPGLARSPLSYDERAYIIRPGL